jgi:hypothetical protein
MKPGGTITWAKKLLFVRKSTAVHKVIAYHQQGIVSFPDTLKSHLHIDIKVKQILNQFRVPS